MLSSGLTLIEPTQALPEKQILWCNFGEVGTLKTSLSMTALNPLHLDFDDGLERAPHRGPSIKVNHIMNGTKIKKTGYGILKGDIISGAFAEMVQQREFKTGIIDTGGTLLDDHIAPYLIQKDRLYRQNDGTLTQKGYGALKQEFKWFVRQLKNMGLDIIVVCHSVTKKVGKKEKEFPSMSSGSLKALKEAADLMSFIAPESDNTLQMNFNNTADHIGKNTANFELITVPELFSASFYTFSADIIAQTKKIDYT